MWQKILGGLVSPVTKLLGKREERKLAKETIKGKLANAKLTGDLNVNLTDAEWERVSASQQNESWKDEYITLSVASILNMIVLGALIQAFGFDSGTKILEGVTEVATTLAALGVDLGFLLKAVVLAAIGLKVWRA